MSDMRSIFGPNDEWTKEADEVYREFDKAMRVVFEKYPDVRPRELDYIARAVSATEHVRILVKRRRG